MAISTKPFTIKHITYYISALYIHSKRYKGKTELFKNAKVYFRYLSVYQMFISFKVNGFVDIMIEKAYISTKPFTLYLLIR